MKRPRGPGRIYTRADQDFEAKVLSTSFNARNPKRIPNILVEANSVEDVQKAVTQAVREGLKVNICSGGHSWAQNHLQNEGMLISLARLNSVEIHADQRLAMVGPGCWGIDLDKALRKHRLFFPIAHAPDVCMGGFLLQGGFGWGSRELGIATESVIGFDAVLPNGELVYASETEHSDLFWAARGSGPGFCAVIVRYHLRLHPRFKFTGIKIQVFQERDLESVYRWADEIGPEVPRAVEFQLLLTPKAMGIFRPGIEVVAPVLTDSWRSARRAVSFIDRNPIKRKASFTTPLLPLSTPMMSTVANVTHFPPKVKWCADNMWTNAPIEALIPGIKRIADTMPPAPSHALWLNWYPPGQRQDMAFSLEANRYLAVYGMWRDDQDDARYSSWAGDRMDEMSEHALGIQLADENLGRRPARFMANENMRRLDQIRDQYDPHGLLRGWMGRID